MKRFLGALSGVALLATAGGCGGGDSEVVRRFEAQRLRWQVDREELSWSWEQARDAHLDIERRFGTAEPPSDAALRDVDLSVRLQIAATSLLHSVNLEARYGGPTLEVADAYHEIARKYAFDQQVYLLSRFGEGKTLEQVGQRVEAGQAYQELVTIPPEVTDTPEFEWARTILVTLDVHAAVLAHYLDEAAANNSLRAARARMESQVQRWEGSPSGLEALRGIAALTYVLGDRGAAAGKFEALLASATTPDEAAELYLLLGEVNQFGLDRPAAAEAMYTRAVEQGRRVRDAAEAQVRLVELRLSLQQPQVAVRTADELFTLGARALEDRKEEAHYWRARCHLALGHWEDALPALAAGATGNPDSPFALACAARRYLKMREFNMPDADDGLNMLLRAADAVPPPSPVSVPTRWVVTWRERRKRFAWQEGLDALRSAARRATDEDMARRTREVAERIEAERLGF